MSVMYFGMKPQFFPYKVGDVVDVAVTAEINGYKGNDTLTVIVKEIHPSTIDIDHRNLKSENKVIAICQKQEAERYINAIGGIDLYDKDRFKKVNIDLNFIKSNSIVYKQFNYEFIPSLSIIDVMMHNSKETIQEYLKNYTLI